MTLTPPTPTASRLVDTLQADERARKASAEAGYRDALAKARTVDSYRATLSADDPAALAALRDVMAELGLSPADVAADAKAIADHARASAGVLTPDMRAAAQSAAAAELAAVRAERLDAIGRFTAAQQHRRVDHRPGRGEQPSPSLQRRPTTRPTEPPTMPTPDPDRQRKQARHRFKVIATMLRAAAEADVPGVEAELRAMTAGWEKQRQRLHGTPSAAVVADVAKFATRTHKRLMDRITAGIASNMARATRPPRGRKGAA